MVIKKKMVCRYKNQIFAIIGFAVFFNGWVILNYRKGLSKKGEIIMNHFYSPKVSR